MVSAKMKNGTNGGYGRVLLGLVIMLLFAATHGSCDEKSEEGRFVHTSFSRSSARARRQKIIRQAAGLAQRTLSLSAPTRATAHPPWMLNAAAEPR